jgi:hypothetical protein
MEPSGKRVVDLPDMPGMAEEILSRGFAGRVAFTGTSMTPMLRHGDFLVVQALPGAPARGDVLLYRSGPRLVAHRFLRTRGALWLLKGDATAGAAEVVEKDRIVGRVVALQRGGKTRRIDRGAFRILNPLAGTLSPWLPSLLLRTAPRPFRRLLREALRFLWSRAQSI